MKLKINWFKLLLCIIGVLLVGNIGSLATFSQITTWYAELTKPNFNPPSWIFGPVWTLLFILIGTSLYLAWTNATLKQSTKILTIFAIQMALNVLWSFIFFGWHEPGLAFLEIILLWIMIVLTIIEFKKVSKLAAWLLVPYLAWVSFATVLTYAIWQLN